MPKLFSNSLDIHYQLAGAHNWHCICYQVVSIYHESRRECQVNYDVQYLIGILILILLELSLSLSLFLPPPPSLPLSPSLTSPFLSLSLSPSLPSLPSLPLCIELHLAARLGKTLLERNTELEEQLRRLEQHADETVLSNQVSSNVHYLYLYNVLLLLSVRIHLLLALVRYRNILVSIWER